MKPSSLRLAELFNVTLCALLPALAGCEVHMMRTEHVIAAPESPNLEIAVDSFAGSWTDGDLVLEIVDRGAQLEVRYPNGRGPFVAKRSGPGEISVDFYDDAPCCSGRLASPDRIDWSNGGSWHRVTGPQARVGVGIDVRLEPTTGPTLPPAIIVR